LPFQSSSRTLRQRNRPVETREEANNCHSSLRGWAKGDSRRRNCRVCSALCRLLRIAVPLRKREELVHTMKSVDAKWDDLYRDLCVVELVCLMVFEQQQ
jgi:hypothetical protein